MHTDDYGQMLAFDPVPLSCQPWHVLNLCAILQMANVTHETPSHDGVRYERNADGTVVTIVLSRPASRNAVDGPTAAALAHAFRTFEADSAATVAVLWGEGGTFCAGADLKAFATEPHRANAVASPEGGRDGPMGPTRMQLSKPTIAAISGYAVAGGLELACWADLRVAEEDAILGVFCRRFGVPLIDGGTIRLPALIGLSRALDLIRTCTPTHPHAHTEDAGCTHCR